MKSSRILILLLLALLPACGGGGSSANNDQQAPPAVTAQDDNVMKMTVNGSLCSQNSYPNKPCVSVTVCTPGTNDCQTIDDILLDTGSYGLRIFKQVLTVPLKPITKGQLTLAECVNYADGTAHWGPVHVAKIILANEPPVEVPIQVLDAKFGAVSDECSTPDIGPADGGFNGILGVGFFGHDCGTTCSDYMNNRQYYACSSTDCIRTKIDLVNQVQNPISLLPKDNNGIIVQLPAVPQGGLSSLDGSLVLGIDTRPNNAAPKIISYQANTLGNFLTSFEGSLYNSFLDTGSNGLYFPPPSTMPICDDPVFMGWYCPQKTVTLSATNMAINGTPAGQVPFLIGNTVALFTSKNNVFAENGAPFYDAFDWGLPFFFGRNVYVGYDNGSSSLGKGLYWAY